MDRRSTAAAVTVHCSHYLPALCQIHSRIFGYHHFIDSISGSFDDGLAYFHIQLDYVISGTSSETSCPDFGECLLFTLESFFYGMDDFGENPVLGISFGLIAVVIL